MANGGSPRRSSLVFPILLIAVGVLILYANWRPDFDPWPVLWTYWPLILIFIGLGKIWDTTRRRQNPDAPPSSFSVGTTVGAVAFVLVLAILFWHGRDFTRRHGGSVYAMQHQTRTVDAQGAKSVHVSIDMGAGELTINSGSSHLLDADFDYRLSSGAPTVNYSVSGTSGSLDIAQQDSGSHVSTTSDNHWTLQFANDIPLELKINMGAGRGNLHLRDLSLTRLNLDMGAGQVDVDLTGERRSDLNADIEGGVGEANIRLPKNVGVIVNASGGIGTIDTHGLKHDGDQYINDAYGKAPATIHLRVEGGVGRINLTQEP
jgi:hypothetical protein